MKSIGRTKETLLKELRNLQQKYDLLKTSYEKDNNKRKKSEKELRESEELFRMLTDTTSSWIIIYQGEHIVYVNKANLNLTGYTEKEILHMHFWDLIHPDYQELVRKRGLARQLGEQVLNRYEVKIVCKDGEERWIDFSAGKIEWRGKPAVLGTAFDITERKRSEELIRESEEKFRTVADFTYDWEYWEGKDGQILYISPSCERISGYKPEQFLSDSLLLKKIIHPDDSKLFDDHFEKAHSVEDFQDIGGLDFRIIKKDGSVAHIGHVCQPVIDYKSNYHGRRISNRDITERKLAEEELRLEKENFRHSLDDSPLGVRIVTLEGKTIYANQAIIDIYGYDSLGELQKTPSKDRYTPEGYHQAQKRKKQRERGDLSATEYEISIIRKNGEIRHLQVYRKEVLWNGAKQFQVIYEDISRRKQTEVALRESEERYSSLMEGSPDAIVVHSKGKIVYVNEAGLKLIGAQSLQELIGKPVLDVVHPDSRSKVIDRLRQTAEGKEVPLFEEKFVKFDGSVIDVEVVGIPCLYQGQIAAQAIIREITERKLAEKVLRESEEWFRMLADTTSTCILIYQGEHIVYVNKANLKLTGYTEKEILHMRFWDFAHPDYQELVRKRGLARQLGEQVLNRYEVKIVCKDGEERWIDFTAGKIEWRGKSAVLVTAYDITERTQVESKLKQALEWNEAIFEGSRDAVFISDQDSCFVSVNNAASYLTGYSREQLLKMRIPDIHDLSDLEAYKMYHQRIFGGEEILSEAKILQSDGTKLDTEFSNRCVSIAGKSYMHTTARNITKRKLADEALKNLLSLTEATLASIHNGILVVSLQRFIIKTNARFAEMWRIPEDILKFGDDNILLNYVLGQLTDPDAFISKVEELYENPEAESFDLISFKDGRIFGRISRPMHLGGEPKARVWSFFDLTEPKQAEEKLRLEKENFRHSLDDSPLGVRIVTLEGKTIYANQAIIDIYGYDSLGELQKTPLKDRYTPESYHQAQKRKKQRERGDLSATDYEISIVRKNGEIRHLQVYRKVVLWNGVKQFQAIYMDISKRKLAEVALWESEERYRRLVEGSPDAIAIHSNGKFVFVNEAGLKLVGAQSPQELIGKNILDVVPPVDRSKVNDRLRQITEGKEAPLYEEKFMKFDRSVIDVEVVGIPCFYQGQVATQVIVREITERKQAEKALKESEAKFRSLFENSLMGISITGIDGHLVQVNLAYAQMHGYKNPEEMLTEITNVVMLYANPVEREEVLRILRRKGFMEAREVEVVRRDGSRFFDLLSVSEIRDSEGKLLYNQAIHIDVTDRRQNEGEIKKSKELLEKLYQHLNEIREEERALISREIHDRLGQSMTALKLDLKRMHSYIDTNPDAVKKLNGLIELVSGAIMDVQRISSDLRPGILDELGLVPAIEWYCDEVEERTGIKFNLKLDDSDYTDSQINLTFFRVLQETLTNVIRHANASSVSIKLHKSESGVTMSIKDNGIGITKEQIESYRSLGLISMRERVKQFNGTIDISSKKDSGTKLTIFIPSVNS